MLGREVEYSGSPMVRGFLEDRLLLTWMCYQIRGHERNSRLTACRDYADENTVHEGTCLIGHAFAGLNFQQHLVERQSKIENEVCRFT